MTFFDNLKAFIQTSEEGIALRENPSFELATIRQGKLPAVIIINGFLSDKGSNSDDWLSVVDELYPENTLFQVKWKAGNIKDMILEKGLISEQYIATHLFSQATMPKMIAAMGIRTVNKISGHWKQAFHETQHVGIELAVLIEKSPELENCILMGHSLGARIVRHTLNNLKTPNLVSTGYLFAGAVSAKNEDWQSIVENHPNTKIVNCWSTNDAVLKTAYRMGTLLDHDPAGLTDIMKEHKNINNFDVTNYVDGHMRFKQKALGVFLKNQIKMYLI